MQININKITMKNHLVVAMGITVTMMIMMMTMIKVVMKAELKVALEVVYLKVLNLTASLVEMTWKHRDS